LFNEKEFDDNSIACKFPARKSWLQTELKINNFPKVSCKKYDQWFKQLDPTSSSLIFPAGHINSPASMFGHTFLKINSSYNSKLLAHAINYAASADKSKENGFLFAIKGLFGGYYGQYSLLPYYEKLKEYRDTEQRDIWEYNLNLSKSEVVKMVNHIWELKDTYSYYYFFDENCSYNMLWLLEIARPTIKLREKFSYQISPPETIFEIDNAGLIKTRGYRPSKRKVLLEYEKKLNTIEIAFVKTLALKESSLSLLLKRNISLQKQQLILETATELCEYFYIQGKIKKEKYLRISHQLSKQRASLGKGEKLIVAPPVNPDQAHRQLGLALGYRHNEKDSLTFSIRPTYHDITNNDNGFLAGTQIEFLTPQLSYDLNSKNLKTDYLKLLTITSLAPETKIFNPLSWSTKWQFNRESLNNKLNFNGQISAGKTIEIGKQHLLYALADGYIYPTNYSNSAIGSTLGAILYPSQSTKLNIEANYKIYDSSDKQKILSITQSYFPKNSIDIKLKYEYIEKIEKNQNTVNLSLYYFF